MNWLNWTERTEAGPRSTTELNELAAVGRTELNELFLKDFKLNLLHSDATPHLRQAGSHSQQKAPSLHPRISAGGDLESPLPPPPNHWRLDGLNWEWV